MRRHTGPGGSCPAAGDAGTRPLTSGTVSQPDDGGEAVATQLAERLVDRLPALTDRLVELICAEERAYREAGPDVLADVRRSCHENLTAMVHDLAGRGSFRIDAPRQTARHRAEQGVPLASVLHAYRLGLRVVWEALTDEADERRGALLATVTRLWTILDTYSQAVAGAYEEALVELARRDERRRTLLLDGLLDGREPAGALRGQLASALGLPDRGPYLVVSADVPAPGQEGLPQADEALRRRGVRSAWRLRADEQIGVVALDQPSGVVRDVLRPLALTRTGISPPYADLRDTARARLLAGLARQCVAHGDPAVTTLDEQPFGALMAGNPEMAEHLARTVLGQLLDLDADERLVLLDTLRAWVDGGGSATEAAQRLFCHRNTVRNRLHRIEELTGRSVSDPRSLVELCAAAEAVRLLDLAAPVTSTVRWRPH